MDKGTAARKEEGIRTIKAFMPQTYAEIQRLASLRGNEVYRLVRDGCGGKPNSFYAIEDGHVVGTPFAKEHVDPAIAALIVQYGMGFFMMIEQ